MSKRNNSNSGDFNPKPIVNRQFRDILIPPRKRQVDPRVRGLIFGLFVLIAFGAFYYFVNIKNKETEFDEKRFRSLATLSDNLVNRYLEFSEIQEGDNKVSLKLDSQANEKVAFIFKRSLPINLDTNGDVEYLPFKELFESILPSAIFDYFVVIRSDSLVYQDIDNGLKVNSDTVFNKKFEFPEIDKVEIGGKSYRSYSHQFDFMKAERSFYEKTSRITASINEFKSNENSEDTTKRIKKLKTELAKYEKLAGSLQDDWTIIGYVSNRTFTQEITKVNIWFVIILTIGIFIVLACLPILKLLFIGEVELIKAKDAILTTISISIGVPLITIVALGLFIYLDRYKTETDEALPNLNQSIRNRFSSELGEMLYGLEDFEEKYQSLKEKDTIDHKYDSSLSYKDYNEITKIHVNQHDDTMDDLSSGTQLKLVSVLGKKKMIDLGYREYFQKVVDGDVWNFNKRGIYLQSLVSWYSGKREAVLSTRAVNDSSNYVLAMSSTMSSVFNTVMPPPYQFCVINETGKVLFHSKENRNTNEDFLDELDFKTSNSLKAAMAQRQPDYFTSNYWGKRTHGYLAPVEGLPLFIVTFYDLEETRLFISEVMSTTLTFFSLSIIVAILFMSTTLLLEKRRNKYTKLKDFAFDWLRPSIKKKNQYLMLSLYFLLVSMILIVHSLFFHKSKFPEGYAWELLIPCFSFFVIHNFLDDKMSKYTPCVQVVSLLIFAVILSYFFDSGDSCLYFFGGGDVCLNDLLANSENVLIVMYVLIWQGVIYNFRQFSEATIYPLSERGLKINTPLAKAVVLFFFVVYSAFLAAPVLRLIFVNGNSLIGSIPLLVTLYIIIGYALVYLLKKNSLKISNWLHSTLLRESGLLGKLYTKTNENCVACYNMCLGLWILSSFIIPVISIFFQAKHEEDILWNRYSQLEFAKSFQKKVQKLHYDYSRDDISGNGFRDLAVSDSYIRSKVDCGNYTLPSSSVYRFSANSTNNYIEFPLCPFNEDSFTRGISIPVKCDSVKKDVSRPSPRVIRARKNLRLLLGATSYNLSKLWEPNKSNGICWLNNKKTKGSTGRTNIQTLVYSDSITPYTKYNYLVKQDFINTTFLKNGEYITWAIIFGLILLIAFCFLIQIVTNSLFGFKFFRVENSNLRTYANLFLTERSNWCTYIVVTPGADISGLDYGNKKWLKPSASKETILELLNYLKEVRSAKIKTNTVICSHYYPSYMLRYMANVFDNSKEQSVLEEFVRLFGEMPQCIVGFSTEYDEDGESKAVRPNRMLTDVVLHKPDESTLKGDVFERGLELLSVRDLRIVNEIRILENEGSLFSYYLHLWHTLSDREKYVLYDLSKDGFVNIKSTKAIHNLIYKGILYWNKKKSRLSIFNDSFRSFVLNSVVRDYGKQIEKDIGEQSTWASLSVIIYLLIIAALLFVSLSEPDFFSDFNSFITVVASIITIIPTVSTFFTRAEDG